MIVYWKLYEFADKAPILEVIKTPTYFSMSTSAKIAQNYVILYLTSLRRFLEPVTHA